MLTGNLLLAILAPVSGVSLDFMKEEEVAAAEQEVSKIRSIVAETLGELERVSESASGVISDADIESLRDFNLGFPNYVNRYWKDQIASVVAESNNQLDWDKALAFLVEKNPQFCSMVFLSTGGPKEDNEETRQRFVTTPVLETLMRKLGILEVGQSLSDKLSGLGYAQNGQSEGRYIEEKNGRVTNQVIIPLGKNGDFFIRDKVDRSSEKPTYVRTAGIILRPEIVFGITQGNRFSS